MMKRSVPFQLSRLLCGASLAVALCVGGQLSDAVVPAKLNLTLVRDTTFGPIVVRCKDASAVAVNITGWTVYAQVRKNPEGTVIVNLAPTVTDGAAGELTIPAIAYATTKLLPEGAYHWDLILQKPSGERLGPFLAGDFVIKGKITQP